MHELFSQVLNHKDLSKAGELFSLDDKTIEKDLTEVLDKIRGIVNTKEYESCNNDQSVVEICIQRVTTAIRETDSIERHFTALVSLLDVCLKYNLKPSSKDEDPPHSKIASDIMSCLFIHYYKQSVMENALPTVVHFLSSQNKELCRNVSSYLSLVAIDSAALLSKHSELIINSVLQGNHSLTCVLPQIFTQNKQPILNYSSDLISLLDKCDVSEKTSLLQLLGMIAKSCPKLVEPYVFKFSEYLSSTVLAPFVLLMFVDMATINPAPFIPMATELKLLAVKQPVYCLQVVQIIAALSTFSKSEAQASMAYLISQMTTAEQAQLLVILQEIRRIGQRHRNLLAENIVEINKLSENSSGTIQTLTLQLQEDNRKYSGEKEMRSVSSQTEGTVTVITVGNPPNAAYPSGTVAVKMSSSAVSSQQSLAKSSKASSSNVRPVNQLSSPASTLVFDHASVSSGVTIGSNTVTKSHRQSEPVRDAMLTFCEKHLTTIKSFISSLSTQIPLPAKCRVVNGKHRRYVKLYFLCTGQGSQCLYNQNYFTLDTKVPKTWIHLMFLAIQACSSSALSQLDASVSSLRNCWETLRSERGGNSSFLTLVTSSFPSTKDQDTLLHELYSARYFDVFEFNEAKKHWACFMCNHPEKMSTLLPDGVPAISDQLKEKKGKWKFLKRWKTRNFTLSGTSITYNKSNDRQETLPISMIQSVKAVRKGIRDIPKAFEIFTANQTYVFKVKDRTRVEQWVQCIHIAVARSQKIEAEQAMMAKTSRPKSMIHDTKL